MNTIWFLILTYRRPESLLRLINSVLSQSTEYRFSFRFLIWDNDGNGESYRRFARSPYGKDPRFSYLFSPNNLKMAGKRALEDYLFDVIKPNYSDWIVHLDDDVQLSECWLRFAYESASQRGWQASGSTEYWQGVLIYSGQTMVHRVSSSPGGPQDLWIWHFEPVLEGSGPVPVQFAGHRAMLIRADTAHSVRHDPEMRIGGEDLDYSLSLRAAGAVIGIDPRAIILHRNNGEIRKASACV